jgi:hypothetical protein
MTNTPQTILSCNGRPVVLMTPPLSLRFCLAPSLARHLPLPAFLDFGRLVGDRNCLTKQPFGGLPSRRATPP